MKTKILKILSVFVAVTIAFSCFTFSVSAVEPTVYTIQYQKPSVNEYSGYVEFLSVDGAVYVVTWNFVLQSNVLGTIAPPKITIKQSIVSEFYIECSFSDVPEYVHLSYTTTKFNSQNTDSDVWGTYASYAKGDNKIFSTYFAFVPSGAKAVRVNGNARLNLIGGFTNSTDNWTVTYGSDTALYYKLEVLKEILQSISSVGSGTAQPDFGSTNNALDSTTAEMQAVENGYKIDEAATTQELNKGSAFISSTDMQRASVQVKSWIEEFASENKVFSSFLVAALCLGLCFWVIGRKTSK